MKVVIVTGSREWTNMGLIFSVLSEEAPDLVVHGGARGADRIAHMWAVDREVDVAGVNDRLV